VGKLIYLMNVSLDGFVETPDHSLDWATVDEEVHSWFNDWESTLDASLYGRRLWEVMSSHWPTAEKNDPDINDVEREYARIWNRIPKIVFSTSLDHVEHGARLVRGDVGEVLTDVRREFPGNLGVGGPNLAGQFVRRGLVDQFQMVVHPVVLGAGTPFWPPLDSPMKLRLTDTHRFESGAVAATYVPA
jgi:dihydrofolate reductase